MLFRPALIGLCVLPVMFACSESRAQMACGNEIGPLRAAVEKEGLNVKAAIEAKDRTQICESIKRFASTEAKFVKYIEDNSSWCGIPPDAVKQLKANHQHSLGLRGKACSAGAQGARPAGPPPGPGLSDALGTSRGPTPGQAKTGRGTFDTLTGNPFQR
jgi:hypothetical protein